jgi:predicted  nucleic acid-binding Zn-ribbon protein
MAFTNVLPIHSVLFAADLVRREGCRFDEALPVLEDWDFWLQVTQHTDVRHAPGISALYRYRDRAGLQRDDHLHHHRQWREKVQARWLQRLGPEQVGRAATWYAQALDETRQQLQAASGLRAAQLLRDELDVVQGRLRDTQAELQMAAERLSTSAYELTSSQAQQKLLEGQVQDLRQFAELRARLSDELREQLTRAEIKLRDTQAELQQAGLDLADATTQGAAEREALVQAEQERTALTGRVEALLAAAEGARAESERLQTLVDSLSGQLEQVRRSSSWRVTAPLRWLGAVGRRWLR